MAILVVIATALVALLAGGGIAAFVVALAALILVGVPAFAPGP